MGRRLRAQFGRAPAVDLGPQACP